MFGRYSILFNCKIFFLVSSIDTRSFSVAKSLCSVDSSLCSADTVFLFCYKIIRNLTIATDKTLFFIQKCWYLSYFSTKTYVVVLIRSASARRGASNEYPQRTFSSRNKKNIMWIPPLICSYDFTLFGWNTILFGCKIIKLVMFSRYFIIFGRSTVMFCTKLQNDYWLIHFICSYLL